MQKKNMVLICMSCFCLFSQKCWERAGYSSAHRGKVYYTKVLLSVTEEDTRCPKEIWTVDPNSLCPTPHPPNPPPLPPPHPHRHHRLPPPHRLRGQVFLSPHLLISSSPRNPKLRTHSNACLVNLAVSQKKEHASLEASIKLHSTKADFLKLIDHCSALCFNIEGNIIQIHMPESPF